MTEGLGSRLWVPSIGSAVFAVGRDPQMQEHRRGHRSGKRTGVRRAAADSPVTGMAGVGGDAENMRLPGSLHLLNAGAATQTSMKPV